MAGLWRLEVVDTSGADGAVGTLNGWSLEATPMDPSLASARSYRVAFPRQQLSGTYTVDLGADIRSIAAPGFPNGFRVDANLNAGLDAVRQEGRTPGATTETKAFNPTADQTGVILSPGRTAISTILVPEDFVVQDAEITLNIQIPNTANLAIYLITPTGQRVRLAQGVGAGANFSGTILDDGDANGLDDMGNPIPSITSGAAPFSGRFRPQEPLDVLNGRSSVDGSGLYTLEITNNSVSQTGTLTNWQLRLDKLLVDGLGETIADRTRLDFRIFTMEATDTQASSVWTPLGPTGLDGAPQGIAGSDRSGQVGALAIDPSDPTGNTVYIGGASGGVWKTTNFLTADPEGPTWVPLTDFGPDAGQYVSTIAIIPIDNDPSRSIIFAGTGDPSTGTGTGTGILRSTDGGATWTVLDSTNNAPAFNTSGRDRALTAPVLTPSPSTRSRCRTAAGWSSRPCPTASGGRSTPAGPGRKFWPAPPPTSSSTRPATPSTPRTTRTATSRPSTSASRGRVSAEPQPGGPEQLVADRRRPGPPASTAAAAATRRAARSPSPTRRPPPAPPAAGSPWPSRPWCPAPSPTPSSRTRSTRAGSTPRRSTAARSTCT